MTDGWWAGFATALVVVVLLSYAYPLADEVWHRWRDRRIIAAWRKKVYGEDMKR